MHSPTAEQILEFAAQLEGMRLTTNARKTPFSLAVLADGIEFTPASSGKPRPLLTHDIQRICDEYCRTKSVQPKDYQGITFNASYVLTLIEMYQNENKSD